MTPPPEPLPGLKWEGPDEDGDVLVTLINAPKVGPSGLTVHGESIELALHRFGGMVEALYDDECPDCAKRPPCQGCGGPHPFDTTVPSVRWNAVIRKAGLPDYLCLTCIVSAFVKAGESFTAELVGEEHPFEPIEIRTRGQSAIDATVIGAENTALRARISELEAALPSPAEERLSEPFSERKMFSPRELDAIAGPLRAALEELTAACERDFESVDTSVFGDDEAVGGGMDGDCAVTFGMIRRARKVLTGGR